MHRFVASLVVFVLGSTVLIIGCSTSAYGGGVATDSGGTISVGASDDGSSGGTPGNIPVEDGGGNGSAGGDPAGFVPQCSSMVLALNNDLGPPAGVTTPGSWYSITCTTADGGTTTENPWIPTASTSPVAGAVDPQSVAMQAENSLQLPSPAMEFNPTPNAIVNLPTWLWIDAGIWHPFSVSATVGSVTSTATATPVSVTWSLGNGDTVTCPGPGTVYQTDRPSTQQQTYCSYTYSTSSAGQPSPDGRPNDGAFHVTAAVKWRVSWQVRGASGGGSLPELTTSSATSLRVEQVESVNS